MFHGTTVATNAILEGKGARVGLVTTEGFRQVLQIARSFVPGGLAGWIIWPKPEPLAALEDTVEVRGRIASDGSVVTELAEDDVRAKLRNLSHQGIEALSISLINAYANPAHELRVGEIATEELPGIPVSLSSSVLPELREYERTITTVVNAAVQPHVSRYVANLDAQLTSSGVHGKLCILRSDGGLVSAAVAAESPVNMLMSGPAGGVTGATWAAEQAGFQDFLTFDMGGTSTDVALVQELKPRIGRETTVGDLKVRATSVDVRTVGAGGGSIAHVPALTQALRVGPQSAGAVPGPAAYAAGGTEPTVTDANVVLGYLPTQLAGGEITLDRDAAARRQDDRRRHRPGLGGSGSRRDHRHRQREHVRGTAPGLGAAGLRSARLRARGLRGRRSPARQRPRQADRSVAGHHPAVARCAQRVRRRHHSAARRVRPHPRATVRRAQRRLSQEILTELADDAMATLTPKASPRTSNRSSTPPTSATTVRVSRFRSTIDVDTFNGTGGGLASLRTAFDAAHNQLFSFVLDAEHELVPSGPRPTDHAPTWRGPSWRRATRTQPPR